MNFPPQHESVGTKVWLTHKRWATVVRCDAGSESNVRMVHRDDGHYLLLHAESSERTPAQGDLIGQRARVRIRGMPAELVGTIVRHDAEDPKFTIIRLDCGFHVLNLECEFQPIWI